jgi:hypothetical protein
MIESEGGKPSFLGDSEAIQDMNEMGLFNKQQLYGEGDDEDIESGRTSIPESEPKSENGGVGHRPWGQGKTHHVDGPGKSKTLATDDVEALDPSASQSQVEASIKKDAFNALSPRTINKKEDDKPASEKNEKVICYGMIILVILFIVVIPITIVTKWGAIVGEPEYNLKIVLQGKLVALSQSGDALVLKDDYDFCQVYNPLKASIGPTFRVRGNVELSADGSVVAFIDDTTQRLQMKKYTVGSNSVLNEDTPFVTGDDISLSSDVSLLSVGFYGYGSITSVNGKVGEGTITTYKYNGTSWIDHGSPLSKLFGLRSFKVSAAGSGMVTITEQNGNTTLTGYKSFENSGTLTWQETENRVTFEGSNVDVAVATDTYAVASSKEAQVISFSGQVWGKAIEAKENTTIQSVALSLDGHTLAVGIVHEDKTSSVEFYSFQKGQDTGDDWASLGNPLRDDSPIFGSSLSLNANANILAVQSKLNGRESVHIYSIKKRK